MPAIDLLAVLLLLLAATAATAASPGDANAGAKLVQSHGCAGCHGAQFQGAIGPKLSGIEHRRSAAQIADAIEHPKPPMPSFGLTTQQTADIVAYLSNLDGGANGLAPTATISPAQPTSEATLTVRFPGTAPKRVSADPTMLMGASSMRSPKVMLQPTADPHVWKGIVHFSMGGPWTIVVTYDGKTLKVPVTVAGSM